MSESGAIQLIGAVGLGAIITKLLDALWLSKLIEKNEARKWLRDNRLEAFSALTSELLSLGFSQEGGNSPFQILAKVSRAILLIDDTSLTERIHRFLACLNSANKDESRSYEERTTQYVALIGEANQIVDQLRRLVIPHT